MGTERDWQGVLGQKIPRFDNRIISKCKLLPKRNVCKANTLENVSLVLLMELKNLRVTSIYGEKIYLIAREENKGLDEYNYLLHKLRNIKLTKESFDSKGFDIQEFSQKSFGVYQGEIFDVKLRFSKEVAEEVANYNFHPTQNGKYNEDGTYTVSFKASGDKHIIWHLFKWGKAVEVLAPEKLKQIYKDYLEDVLVTLK